MTKMASWTKFGALFRDTPNRIMLFVDFIHELDLLCHYHNDIIIINVNTLSTSFSLFRSVAPASTFSFHNNVLMMQFTSAIFSHRKA